MISNKVFMAMPINAEFSFFTIPTEVGELTRKKIDNVARKLRTCVKTCIFLPVVALGSVCYTWFRDTDHELEMVMKFVKQWISEDFIMEQILFWLLIVSILWTFVPTIIILFYYLYIVTTAIIDTLLLIEEVESFKAEHSSEKIVMEHIRDFTQIHLKIKRFTTQITDHNHLVFFGYTCTGLIAATSALYFINSARFSFKDGILLLIGHFSYVYYGCTFGQDYIDSFADLGRALYDLEWYSWSALCQKDFLILFANILQGDRFNFFLLFDISNDLLKKVK
ncbi:uncharacterized protein [Euwallacea similis]|uniref:uncharacterized protein n=1 Tax=Euwallacea similis TaxID=1736056 RepID=UPI00344B647A